MPCTGDCNNAILFIHSFIFSCLIPLQWGGVGAYPGSHLVRPWCTLNKSADNCSHFTIIPTVNLECPINHNPQSAYLWSEGANQSTQRKPTLQQPKKLQTRPGNNLKRVFTKTWTRGTGRMIQMNHYSLIYLIVYNRSVRKWRSQALKKDVQKSPSQRRKNGLVRKDYRIELDLWHKMGHSTQKKKKRGGANHNSYINSINKD